MKAIFLFSLLMFAMNSNIIGQQTQDTPIQQKETGAISRTTIYYPFSNAKSFDQVEELRYEIEQMEFVKKVKAEYKEEKSAGQITVIVEQKIYDAREEHPEFDSKKLKQLFVEKDLIPGNIKVEHTTFNQ